MHQRINEKADVRTTLDIDDDLIAAAREVAKHERSSAGKVISRLLHSLTGHDASGVRSPARGRAVAGLRPFPAQPGIVVSHDDVNSLHEAEGI